MDQLCSLATFARRARKLRIATSSGNASTSGFEWPVTWWMRPAPSIRGCRAIERACPCPVSSASRSFGRVPSDAAACAVRASRGQSPEGTVPGMLAPDVWAEPGWGLSPAARAFANMLTGMPRARDEPVRLTRIYTRGGDAGETSLGDGSRVSKLDLRIAAYGTVDELNSALGVVLAGDVPPGLRGVLERVQNELFDLGADLSVPAEIEGRLRVEQPLVDRLEEECDRFNAELPE